MDKIKCLTRGKYCLLLATMNTDEQKEHEYFRAAFFSIVGPRKSGGQKKLAIDTGISDGMLSHIRSGKKPASLSIQMKIARAQNMTWEDLISLGKSIIETGQPPAVAKSVKPADRPPPPQQYSLEERMLRVLESIDKRLEIMEKRQEEIEKRKIVPLGERKGRR